MAQRITELAGVGPIRLVRRRGLKSLRLSVDSQGMIRLSMPWWVSQRVATSFVRERASWITAQQQQARFVITGDMGFGKSLQLRIMQKDTTVRPRSRMSANQLHIYLPEQLAVSAATSQLYIKKAMTKALRVEAEELLLPRLQALAEQHAFHYHSARVRALRARWGSCSQSKEIVLNLYLIQLPWQLIDYVLLHELTHTVQLHHGPGFWRHFDSVHPDAKRTRQLLRAYRPGLQVLTVVA